MFKRVKILDVEISDVNMASVLAFFSSGFDEARGKYICAANVHTTVMAYENADYREIQNRSFLTLPDGKPLSVVGKWMGHRTMGRVTGPEFMEEILKLSKNGNYTHYFYGSTAENNQKLVDYLRTNYPGLKIAGNEPSIFRPLTKIEEEELCGRIRLSKADFVWVGLGAPLQEKFCAKFSSKTEAVWVGVGGAFSVICGIIPRAPQWMQNFGLEWLYRLMKEPGRLFKRYAVTNSKFVFYLLRSLLRK